MKTNQPFFLHKNHKHLPPENFILKTRVVSKFGQISCSYELIAMIWKSKYSFENFIFVMFKYSSVVNFYVCLKLPFISSMLFFPESTIYHPNIFQRKSLQSCTFVMAFFFLNKNSNCKSLLLHTQKCFWKRLCKEGSNCRESFQTLQFSVEMHKLLRGGWTGGGVNIL